MHPIPAIQHHIHTNPHTPPPTAAHTWQHRVWDTTTIPAILDLEPRIRDLYHHYLDNDDHTAIRHLLRPLVLAKMGGLYTEPDTHPSPGLKNSPYMLDEEAWLTLAPHATPTNPQLTGRILAARPGHPYLASLRRAIERLTTQGTPTADQLGDALLTETLARKKKQDIPLVHLDTVTITPTHDTPTPTPQAHRRTWQLGPLTPQGTPYTRTPPESPRR